jgi:hypothetical protein
VLTHGTLRCGAVKGLRFASMNALESGAPLTAVLAADGRQL